MSGAEAILVLGVISSVVAIVDGTKQVYDAASNAQGLPEAFREVAGRLPIVKNILGSAERNIRDGHVDEAACKSMKPLIDRCKVSAETLDGIFQKVLPADDATRWVRYVSAAKTLGKGGGVETLMKGLLDDVLLIASKHGMETARADQVEQLKKAIEELSAISHSIPDSELDETSITNNNFGNGPMTNNNVSGNQKFQANFGSGEQFQAESQVFHMNNEQIKEPRYYAQVQHFSPASAAPRESYLQRKSEEEILAHLAFDGMHERYDDIAEAHKQTFGWIYRKPELKFVDWLKAGKGIYWISGKAGCGKSTLMKFLFADPRTIESLPEDIENTLISGFFFHDRRENPLLKSQEGLFRAIIFSILYKYRQLIPITLPKRWETARDNISAGMGTLEMRRWSIVELKETFKSIISQTRLRLHLFFIIDGLDEFSGRDQDIIDVLKSLLPASNDSLVRVQLCVSSRPHLAFEQSYLQSLHIKVQDLTADDIKIYVETKFSDVRQLRELLNDDPFTTKLLIKEILSKAEGVFLWVTLVVTSLVDSLNSGDDLKTLQARLSFLPAGLAPLYKHMLEQIDPFYHRHAGQMFRIVQTAVKPLSPLAMSFAEDDPREALSKGSILSGTDIAERHIKVAKRLKARTSGLIEVRLIERDPSENQFRSQDDASLKLKYEQLVETPWKTSRVQYLHLTVKEFLCSDRVPVWLANQMLLTAAAHIDIIVCCLRQFCTTRSLHLSNYNHTNTSLFHKLGTYFSSMREGIIFVMMFHAREAERLTGTSQLAYLEVLDSLITEICATEIGEWKHWHWHWTLPRYGDWSEPTGWQSDYIAYLTAVGMTRSVIDKFERGYNPVKKRGRPLLLYATCNLAPDFYYDDFERDAFDPIIVEHLLKRGCDPNQLFTSEHVDDVRDEGTRTAWESVLLQVYLRFCGDWPHSRGVDHYVSDFDQHREFMRELKLRWLKIIELFLRYGANAAQSVYHEVRRRHSRTATKRSGLFIFNKVFADFDDPLVILIRKQMIAKGATEFEKDMLESKSKLRHIPVFGKALAARRDEKRK